MISVIPVLFLSEVVFQSVKMDMRGVAEVFATNLRIAAVVVVAKHELRNGGRSYLELHPTERRGIAHKMRHPSASKPTVTETRNTLREPAVDDLIEPAFTLVAVTLEKLVGGFDHLFQKFRPRLYVVVFGEALNTLVERELEFCCSLVGLRELRCSHIVHILVHPFLDGTLEPRSSARRLCRCDRATAR